MKMEQDLEKQEEEMVTLSCIYEDLWKVEDLRKRVFSIEIAATSGEAKAALWLWLPSNYPASAPPTYRIFSEHLVKDDLLQIDYALQQAYHKGAGEPIIYEWITIIKDILEEKVESAKKDEALASVMSNVKLTAGEKGKKDETSKKEKNESENVHFFHGDIIVDRKSTFQGHVCAVHSQRQVRAALEQLKNENRKVASATHNSFAYRIIMHQHASTETESRRNKTSTDISHKPSAPAAVVLQDCEDDGENQAGSKLSLLLTLMEAENVLVVVSRWYGGIQLGPDRFRHINNVARQALIDSKLVLNSTTDNNKQQQKVRHSKKRTRS